MDLSEFGSTVGHWSMKVFIQFIKFNLETYHILLLATDGNLSFVFIVRIFLANVPEV